MKIGIIGAGQIGGTLTRRLTKLGHEVFVANSRGPESLADLAKETGAKPVSVQEAARAGEVVVVTIPEGKVRDLPRDLFAGVPEDVVIIDTGNYYPRERDGRIGEIVLAYARSGVANVISSGRRYELDLRAQGRDAAPATATFAVWVESRRLQFATVER